MQFSNTCADYPIYNVAIRVVEMAHAATQYDMLCLFTVFATVRHVVYGGKCETGIDTDSKKRARVPSSLNYKGGSYKPLAQGKRPTDSSQHGYG